MKPRAASRPKNLVIIRERHKLAIRWSHWLNFPLLSIMIYSGVLIYWANRVYTPFVPDRFYDSLHIDHHLAWAMGVHFTFVWPFVINGALYVVYLFLSGNWRDIAPRFPRDFKAAPLYTLYDLGVLPNPPPDAGPYNPAQRLAYTSTIGISAVTVISGLAIYKPVQLHALTFLLGGYNSARVIHFLTMLALIFFLFIHVIQVARSGWNNFRAMIAGFEVVKNERR